MISDYNKLQTTYYLYANFDFGTGWICNPTKLDFLPNPCGLRVEDQRHKRWLNFLNDMPIQFLADLLLKNKFSLDKCQKKNIIHGLEFDIEMMKGIDKVEQDFLPKIEKLPEKKETYDRLKLKEIFELQKSKNLVEDDQSDPEMSWLQGTTFDEKFDYFVQRKKNENFLEILAKTPKGKVNHSYLNYMNSNMKINFR